MCGIWFLTILLLLNLWKRNLLEKKKDFLFPKITDICACHKAVQFNYHYSATFLWSAAKLHATLNDTCTRPYNMTRSRQLDGKSLFMKASDKICGIQPQACTTKPQLFTFSYLIQKDLQEQLNIPNILRSFFTFWRSSFTNPWLPSITLLSLIYFKMLSKIICSVSC